MLKKQIKKEKGITLVALIITIIILIILAAVSINAVYESQIIGYATNGVQNYVDAAKTENQVFENTISYVDSVLENLGRGRERYAPIITIAGEQTNGYYKGNVTLTITIGDDVEEEVSEIRYRIIGAQETAESTVNGDITITEEGESTIIAYTVNSQGEKLEERRVTIKKDTVGPVFSGLGEITVDSSYTDSIFREGVRVEDETSGVNGTFSYTPDTLVEGTNIVTYTAVDKAGNEARVTRTIILETTITGILSEIVQPEHYGNTINYSANGIEDWKIFYNDDTNVFIIASDIVPNSTVDTEALGMSTDGSYCVYWADETSLVDTSITVGKYMLSGVNTFTTTNINYKATAALMNTEKWKSFVNEIYADSAIGSPTLDMYIESWNAKYPSNQLYLKADATGYYVGTSANPATYDIDMNGTEGHSETLYYPHTTHYEDCWGYSLASPSAERDWYVMRVRFTGDVSSSSYGGTRFGVRPVVCLKSTVEGTLSGTNWTL